MSSRLETTDPANQARRVLAEFPPKYQPESLRLIDRQGFSGAQIFQVKTSIGDFALRAWPSNGPEIQRLRALHRLLSHIFSRGVENIPVPILSSQSSSVVEMFARHWQLEPWMPGKSTFHDNPSDARLVDVMKCLASWHNAAADFSEAKCFETKQGESPGIVARAEQLKKLKSSLSRRLDVKRMNAPQDFVLVVNDTLQQFELLADKIARQLTFASNLQVRCQPCIRDIWHDNLLFTEDRLTGIVDFGAAMSDNIAIDLARCLGSLLGDDKSRWDTAINQYQQLRQLSNDELTLIEVFDQANVLLSGTTWIFRFLNGEQQLASDKRVIDRMQMFLDRMKQLPT